MRCNSVVTGTTNTPRLKLGNSKSVAKRSETMS